MEPVANPSAAVPSRTVMRAVLLIFTVSGAAGLIYEIVWSRQLVLVFGNTTQAVSAILTGFFAGMALGSALGGRLADRVRSPLRLYGIIELILAAVVVATPISFQLINELYRGAYEALGTQPQALSLLRFGLALVALGPATTLMGATLPTLTRYLSESEALSAAFGRLYAANTVGAILGTFAAGLVLIELLGLMGALVVGATCSLVAGGVALLLSRSPRVGFGGTQAGRPAIAMRTMWGDRRGQLALVVALVSGFTSLGYQVLWTRLLASGTGGLTYVFTIILGLFLYGLACGALLFNFVRPRIRDVVPLLAGAQLLVALLVLLGAAAVLARSEGAGAATLLVTFRELIITASLVVLPVTVVMGLTFPATSALLPEGQAHAGENSGALLAVNTLGAIAGSFLVPFALVPLVGSPQAIVVLAAVNGFLGVGLLLYRWRRSQSARRASLAVAGLIVAVAVAAASGPSILVDPSVSRIETAGGTVFETREDEIASVQAGQVAETPQLWVAGTSMTLLTVDARLMSILPLIARPNAQDVLIVAFGMGSSYRSALIAGVKADAVELVPSVPPMFHWYYDDAPAVLSNPDGKIIIADGRNHLELTVERYDVIVTDPPPPLESSGASVISSFEYYRAGRAHLNPGGVMMQWLPFGSSLDEFRAHVRSFAAVFDEVSILFGPGGFGVFMLGSDKPVLLPEQAVREVLSRPGVLGDLSSAFDSPATSVDGWVEVIASQAWIKGPAVRDFAGDGPLITDDRPLPEYFLLRRWLGPPSPPATEELLRLLEASDG